MTKKPRTAPRLVSTAALDAVTGGYTYAELQSALQDSSQQLFANLGKPTAETPLNTIDNLK